MPRLYRELMGNSRWKNFRAEYLETDLWIAVGTDSYDPAVKNYSLDRILLYRNILNDHIRRSPDFLSSLTPLSVIPDSHPLIQDMYNASEAAGTGPMSAVAGAIAEYICNDLIAEFGFSEVVVENGGDIYLKLTESATISVYACESPLSEKIGLIIKPEQTPLSLCCSSATFGHSLSFGTADACMIACSSGALADAYATACCNSVKNPAMVQEVAEMMLQKPGILSVVIINDDRAGIGGSIEITVL